MKAKIAIDYVLGRLHKHCLPGVILLQALVSMAEQPAYQHGISLLHELKYPADFEHFEYANPDAPKGGELKLSTTTPIRNFSVSRERAYRAHRAWAERSTG